MSTTISGLGLAQQDAVGVVLPPVAAENLPRLLLYPDVTGRRDSSFVVLVAAPNGRMIGELRGDLVGAAWKLNSHGQARIELARERVPERLAQPPAARHPRRPNRKRERSSKRAPPRVKASRPPGPAGASRVGSAGPRASRK